MINQIHNMDCLEGMKLLQDKSVDMILCDLPYGVTARNKWDVIIPFDKLWEQYERIIKDDGAIVLTATQPFASKLIMSNPNLFRYDWIWEKTLATGHLNAKKMPMRAHESILVFYKKLPTYNPIKTTGHTPVNSYTKHQDDGSNYGKTKIGISGGGSTERYPRSVQRFSADKQKEAMHPTQKPVALFEYLIKTYTNEGETVLDNCMGSGTTAAAAVNTNRNFIGFEILEEYCAAANERINNMQRVLQVI
ncbi:site-specific DNA-methyltransferase [Bacillus sp. N447-1]|uniref:DNA-methyltransferase n=1 Tax=Bacillus sp. N447-1 TaxID=2789208 RepID=UPI001F604351|nr:site-specific DNA-methyltransferase [Bacillus sp. N447-1]